MSDAGEHWDATRNGPAIEIDPQFEFNRFTRAWHAANPSGNRAELLEDWKLDRSLPIGQCDRV